MEERLVMLHDRFDWIIEREEVGDEAKIVQEGGNPVAYGIPGIRDDKEIVIYDGMEKEACLGVSEGKNRYDPDQDRKKKEWDCKGMIFDFFAYQVKKKNGDRKIKDSQKYGQSEIRSQAWIVMKPV